MDARAGSLWHKTAGEAIPRYRGGPLCLEGVSVMATGYLPVDVDMMFCVCPVMPSVSQVSGGPVPGQGCTY